MTETITIPRHQKMEEPFKGVNTLSSDAENQYLIHRTSIPDHEIHIPHGSNNGNRLLQFQQANCHTTNEDYTFYVNRLSHGQRKPAVTSPPLSTQTNGTPTTKNLKDFTFTPQQRQLSFFNGTSLCHLPENATPIIHELSNLNMNNLLEHRTHKVRCRNVTKGTIQQLYLDAILNKDNMYI